MNLIDKLQSSLSTVVKAETLASFKHDKLIFPENDIRIFIPDLHLVSDQARKHLQIHDSHPDHNILISTLQKLAEFRMGVKNDNKMCGIYFMGDTFDLWAEASPGTPTQEAMQPIIHDHQKLLDIMFDPALGAHFILGNHDFFLYESNSFRSADRRFLMPAVTPTVMALHGDILDSIESWPEQLNKAATYYFSPFINLSDIVKEEIGIKPDNSIGAPYNHLGDIKPCASTEEASKLHSLWSHAWEVTQSANQVYGMKICALVIGHTHSNNIVAYENGDEFFVLIDSGAWIQDIRMNIGEYGTIAVLCENEVRIIGVS